MLNVGSARLRVEVGLLNASCSFSYVPDLLPNRALSAVDAFPIDKQTSREAIAAIFRGGGQLKVYENGFALESSSLAGALSFMYSNNAIAPNSILIRTGRGEVEFDPAQILSDPTAPLRAFETARLRLFNQLTEGPWAIIVKTAAPWQCFYETAKRSLAAVDVTECSRLAQRTINEGKMLDAHVARVAERALLGTGLGLPAESEKKACALINGCLCVLSECPTSAAPDENIFRKIFAPRGAELIVGLPKLALLLNILRGLEIQASDMDFEKQSRFFQREARLLLDRICKNS